MKPGQVLTQWWQLLAAGVLRDPRNLMQAVRAERPDPAQASDRFLNDLPSDDGWLAPERLRAPSFILSEPWIRQQDRADWQHVDPRLMRWAALFIELARRRGIPLYVHSAFRTEAEQQELLRRKVTKAPYPNSYHNTGHAVDIVHGVYQWQMTPQEWSLLMVLGRRACDLVNAGQPASVKLLLQWGGDWRFYDPAHWQVQLVDHVPERLAVGPPVHRTPRFILRHYPLSDPPDTKRRSRR